MNVGINHLESHVYAWDADTLLTPEVQERIVAAVLERLREEERLRQERDEDTRIARRAAELDEWPS